MNAQAVRILIVGNSGSGKSALIRLLMGDHPRVRHLSDVITRYKRRDLPIIIYENNNMETTSNERMMAEMMTLLDDHRKPRIGFSQRNVHAVWYMLSPTDNHVLDDGGLLQNLIRLGKKLPLLLVMTHDDDRMTMNERRLTRKEEEVVVEDVLGSISDSERRESLMESMVRIGRNEDVGWDIKGLRLLYMRTKAFMPKELWNTWAFIMGEASVQGVRPSTMRVLVLGEEREDVEGFLRVVTNRNSPNRRVTHTTISTSHPNVMEAKRQEDVDVVALDHHFDASLPKHDHKSGKGKDVAAADDLDMFVQRVQVTELETRGAGGLQSEVVHDETTLDSHDDTAKGPSGVRLYTGCDDDTSTPLESDSDTEKENLPMAMWQCELTKSRIVFRQPLNINLLLDQDQIEPTAIDPLDIHSPIRAKLNLDCPTRANCAETWRKWLHEDGIHLCVLIWSSKDSDMYTTTEARLHRFLHRYYGLAMQDYIKVAAGSPVPLLIVHSGNGEELRKALATDLLGQVINTTGVQSRHVDTLSWNKDDDATAVREYLQRNVIHGGIGRTRCELFAKMSVMMRNFWYFYESYDAWLLWNDKKKMEERVDLSMDLLQQAWGTLYLDILCLVWRVPQKLMEILRVWRVPQKVMEPTAVHEVYILCIIIFCKWKCNDEILSFEVEETTRYYMDMIDKALQECQRQHQWLFDLSSLPRALLKGLYFYYREEKFNQYLRQNIIMRYTFCDQIRHDIWSEWKHPRKDEDRVIVLVLSKAYSDGGCIDCISSVKKVELLFSSAEAMSRCIGVGVEGAIVRHSRGSRLTHVVQSLEFATIEAEWELEDMISKKGYYLFQVMIAANGRNTNNEKRELHQSVEYGVHSEKRMLSPSLSGIHIHNAIATAASASSEFHVQSDDEGGQAGWRQSSHSPTTTTAADARVSSSTRNTSWTCTYISRVRVTLLPGGELNIGDNTRFVRGFSSSIHPQFEFTFRLQSGGCKECVRSITIASTTDFPLFNGDEDLKEGHHDNIRVTLGTRSLSSTLDVTHSNNSWEDMIKSKQDRIVDTLTICDGFVVENLRDPRRAEFRLRHVSGKQKDVLFPGSYATIRPRFQTVFLPSDNDAAAPYTFEASRDLYSGENDEEPHVQTYEAEFFVNHAMSHMRLSPEDVEVREFIATNQPQFSFEEDEKTEDLQQLPMTNDKWNVLVVGGEREDVEEFLRAATNSDGPKRTLTTTSGEGEHPHHPHSCKCMSCREEATKQMMISSSSSSFYSDMTARFDIFREQLADLGILREQLADLDIDLDILIEQLADLDILIEQLQTLGSPNSRIAKEWSPSSLSSMTSSTLESDDTMGKDALQVAEWESRGTRILFHQPLNINPLLSEVEEKDPMNIHPFNVHSHIRAQLKIDIMTYDELQDRKCCMCILVVNDDNAGGPLQRFLYHYYGLHNNSFSNNTVATRSPAPLLVVRKPTFSQHAIDTLRNSLSSILQYAYIPVMELPMHISLDEVSVSKHIQQNVIHGCTSIRPSAINRHAQQFKILQLVLDMHMLAISRTRNMYMKLLDECLMELPKMIEGPADLISRILDTLCCLWGIPTKLQELLTALIAKTNGVHISYILSIIIYYKCYYTIFRRGDLEDEKKLVHKALEVCKRIRMEKPSLSKESLPKIMLEKEGLVTYYRHMRHMHLGLQRSIHRIRQEQPRSDGCV